MELFGVGIGEAALVLLITLLVVGPERFPQIAREGGKYYRMARRFTAEVTGDLRAAMDELENEVNAQSGDLKAVREIGSEVRAGIAESASDINSISQSAAQAASEPATAPAATIDPNAQIAAAYSEYHTSAAGPAETPEARADRIVGADPFGTTEPAAATPPAVATVAPEADGDAMSRQATEAFEEFRKPPEPTPGPPYSPQQIVGVNPFGSADPPAPVAAAPVEAATKTEEAFTNSNDSKAAVPVTPPTAGA